jgi:hypothetical protein
MMNETEPKYSREYVEIITALENIRTRIESVETILREAHQESIKLSEQVNRHRTELAGIKASAAILGGIAGSVLGVLSRYFLSTNH